MRFDNLWSLRDKLKIGDIIVQEAFKPKRIWLILSYPTFVNSYGTFDCFTVKFFDTHIKRICERRISSDDLKYILLLGK